MSFRSGARRKDEPNQGEATMQKITTFLTYDGRAEEAAELYTSVFENSRILSKSHYGDTGPGEPGSVMTVAFELEGQEFVALNADGDDFTFTPGISLARHLRDPGRGRQLLGEALRGRRAGAVRLAQGQVRRLVADRPASAQRTARRPRPREGQSCDERHAPHGEDRDSRARGGRGGSPRLGRADDRLGGHAPHRRYEVPHRHGPAAVPGLRRALARARGRPPLDARRIRRRAT